MGPGPRLEAIDGGLGQEDLYRALVEGCPDPLMVLQDDRVQFINPAFTDLLGYTAQAIDEGLSIYTLVQEADRSDVRRRYELRLSGGTVTRSYQVDLVGQDGALIPCETSASTISFRGRPADMVLIRDVTARRAAEEQLHDLVSQHRLLAEQSIMGVAVLQGNRVIYANQMLADLVEHSLEEVLSLQQDDLVERIHPEDLPRLTGLVARLQGGEVGQITSVEWRLRSRGGPYRWIETYSKSFMLRGRVAQIIFANDITDKLRALAAERELSAAAATARSEHARALELRQAYDELKEAQDKLVQSGKYIAIGKLASGVAHEMNNPLSVLLGYVSLLQQRLDALPADLRPDFHKALQRIEKAGKRCKTIAINLLTFARQHDTTVAMAPQDLAAVIGRSTELLTDQCQTQGISLRHDVPGGLSVWGNANQLQQVFTNIALNAVQAMTRGGELVIRARAAGQRFVLVEISDSGPGIAERHLNKIFDPFFTTKPVGKGTGLGLSIVYGIIETHGGEVWVDSRPGEGCSFRVKLPTQPRAARALPAAL